MLLSSIEFSEKLEFALRSSDHSIVVFSAFIKKSALEWMLDHTNNSNVKVVARWQKHDLLCGASDFECYKTCRTRGIDFGISFNLHGKVFCIDRQIFVGSANLTTRGLALSKNFNDEFGVGFEAGQSDHAKIDRYMKDVTWLGQDLASAIEAELMLPRSQDSVSEESWSSELQNRIARPLRHLWVHELPFTKPEALLNFDARNNKHLHDVELFDLNIDGLNRDAFVRRFIASNAHKWLYSILLEEKNLSFGAISSRLHDAILDDPLPYRQEIKSLVSNLLGWSMLMPDVYKISRPKHSQVIQLIG